MSVSKAYVKEHAELFDEVIRTRPALRISIAEALLSRDRIGARFQEAPGRREGMTRQDGQARGTDGLSAYSSLQCQFRL